MPTAVLCGYFGFGNVGDEAVLAGAIRLLRATRPDLALTVLSADPAATARDHGVAAIDRAPATAWRAIGRCDLFAAGGGSLVQDATSWRSPLYYLGLQARGNRAARRSAVLAQGIGPLRRPWIRRVAARAFNGADFVSVRDRASIDELRSLGVDGEVVLAGDLAFAAEPAPAGGARDVLRRAGVRDGAPVVAVAPRAWPGIDPAAIAGGVARGVRGALGDAAVVLVPMFPARDLAACETVAAHLPGAVVVRERLDPALAMAVIGAASLVVAVRLHALIFAAAAGVPAVGVGYDPKVAALFADLRAPGLVEADAWSADALATAVAAVLAERGLAEALRSGAARSRALAAEAVRRMAGLL